MQIIRTWHKITNVLKWGMNVPSKWTIPGQCNFWRNLCIVESMSLILADMVLNSFWRAEYRSEYKFWCLCNCLGYVIQFQPYQGSSGNRYDYSLGLSPSLILLFNLQSADLIPVKLARTKSKNTSKSEPGTAIRHPNFYKILYCSYPSNTGILFSCLAA